MQTGSRDKTGMAGSPAKQEVPGVRSTEGAVGAFVECLMARSQIGREEIGGTEIFLGQRTV